MTNSLDPPLSRPAVMPFALIGTLSIVLGGLLSAISAGTPSYLASWSVAYLVLVVGVGQLVLGIGQALLATAQLSPRLIAAQVLTFNVANVAVLAGTAITQPVLVYVGGGAFVVALALFVWGVRNSRTHNKWALYGFRAMLTILLISTPIGLILSSVSNR